MNAIIVALNAQYVHTSLAARSLAASLQGVDGLSVRLAEYTINHRVPDVLQRVYAHKADVYLFSCYIWNVEMACTLARQLRKLLPKAVLLAGGPQADAHAAAFLQANPAFDAVLAGEGEQSLPVLMKVLARQAPLRTVPGLVFAAEDGCAVANPPGPPPDMDALPFAYTDLHALGGRILYYESMRGCPYRCSYCLSGDAAPVRCKSLDKVVLELQCFLDAGVRQVKFVDRTFNCSDARALAIWRYLAQHDNGVTGFHFELAGHLLSEESLAFLATVREGLFQFEIGVQSTNPETLAEIHRPGEQAVLFAKTDALRKAGNVHLHLDLIAGLPHEGFDSFVRSFNEVAARQPHQLQLGFLKVLPGSEMERRAGEYGLVWQDEAPFEVLYTNWLSYDELCRLKQVAAMVELYYNSGRFLYLTGWLLQKFATPFAFWQALAMFYADSGYFDRPLSKTGQYELLGSFAEAQGFGTPQQMQWLCRCDMALHEKPRTVPAWVQVDGSRPQRERVLAFYRSEDNVATYLPQHAGREAKQLLKLAHVEVLPFDPDTKEAGECALLFDYDRRDVTGKANMQRVVLPQAGQHG